MPDSNDQTSNDETLNNHQNVSIGNMTGSQFVMGSVNGDLILNPSDQTGVDAEKLAAELAQLRQALKKRAQTGEHDIAIGAVAQAEQAARENNLEKVLTQLKTAGKWALDVATEIGVNVASEVLKRAVGAG